MLHLTDSGLALGPGDVVVQRGTDHAWENRSNAVTRMAFFHLDARFGEELRAVLPEKVGSME